MEAGSLSYFGQDGGRSQFYKFHQIVWCVSDIFLIRENRISLSFIPWQLIWNLWVIDKLCYHWGFLKEGGLLQTSRTIAERKEEVMLVDPVFNCLLLSSSLEY